MKKIIEYLYIKIFGNPYEYGICLNRFSRRHKTKGNVQFILSKVKNINTKNGKRRLWVDFDSKWWSNFKTTK